MPRDRQKPANWESGASWRRDHVNPLPVQDHEDPAPARRARVGLCLFLFFASLYFFFARITEFTGDEKEVLDYTENLVVLQTISNGYYFAGPDQIQMIYSKFAIR